MKNRMSVPMVGGLMVLAIIGVVGMLMKNPVGFLQKMAVFALIGLAIYFIFQQITKANPQKQEQKAFLRAAKKSKKRFQNRNTEQNAKSTSQGTLASLRKNKKAKKNSPVHLTVIEGKKGKRKNRASL